MAIIAITRQVAALGDEVAALTAEKLGYRFIDKKYVEQKLIESGFSKDKLKKYDEVKPGFLASLAKERDEFLDYLQTVILNIAVEGNCVLIGRGASFILDALPNLLSFRLIADDKTRIERLKKEFDWDDKRAKARVSESDSNRTGYYKSFFNIDVNAPEHYNMVINTGLLDVEEASDVICACVNKLCTPAKEAEGKLKIRHLMLAQNIVNELVFTHNLNINFLRAEIEDKKIILQGVADSASIVEHALVLTRKQYPDYTVESMISVVQDFNNYQSFQ